LGVNITPTGSSATMFYVNLAIPVFVKKVNSRPRGENSPNHAPMLNIFAKKLAFFTPNNAKL
jgi:hypothetical protein